MSVDEKVANLIELVDKLSDLIVYATCCLHNYLIEVNPPRTNQVDHWISNEKNALWRSSGEMISVQNLRGKKAHGPHDDALNLRTELTDTFLLLDQ